VSDELADRAVEEHPMPVGRAVLVYVVCLAALGLLGGALWKLLTTPPSYTIGDDHGAIITEQGLSQVFALDIWYVFIAAALGLVLGAIAWGLFHQLGWPVVLLVVVGGVATGLLCWYFGHLLGPRDFADRVAAASPGDRVPVDLAIHSPLLTLVWPLAGVLSVFVGSCWDQLRRWHR